MKVTIAGQYQGETDTKTAKETKSKYPDTKLTGRCLVCGQHQILETIKEKCKQCDAEGLWI
jgi:hypothetical protein